GARGPDRGGRGLPLAARILPGTQQALVQLTHVLRQGAWVFRPLVGPTDGRGAVLWGHRLLLPRWRRPRPAPPDTVGAWHRHWCGPHPAPWPRHTPLQSPSGARRARVIPARHASISRLVAAGCSHIMRGPGQQGDTGDDAAGLSFTSMSMSGYQRLTMAPH